MLGKVLIALIAVAAGLLSCRASEYGSLQAHHAHQGRHPAAMVIQEAYDAQIQQIRQWASSDGLIAWTLANHGWRDFAANWVASVRRAGIKNFFVACMDDRLYEELKSNDVPAIALSTGLGEGDLNWGSDAFKQRGMQKIEFIVRMLHAGLQPAFSDLDAVWLKSPFDYFRRYQKASVLVSTDSCMPQSADLDNCQLLLGDKVQSLQGLGIMNVGVHLMRPSSLPFAKAWLEEMYQSGAMEQQCWNVVFQGYYNRSSHADQFCRIMQQNITFGLLPAAVFMNGESFFNQKSHMVLGFEPYIVHASYVPGRIAKREHFIEEGLWQESLPNDQEQHKLIFLELDIPSILLDHAGPPEQMTRPLHPYEAQGHFNLVRHQYIQVKGAAEIALALNMTLVLPKFWCGLENLWMMHSGRFGDFQYELPAECSFMQLFDVQQWQSGLENNMSIPRYMHSAAVPNIARQNAVRVGPCKGEFEVSQTCCFQAREVCDPNADALHLSHSISKQKILSLLQASSMRRNIHLSKVQLWWPLREEANFKFNEAFDLVRRPWCCADDNKHVTIHLEPWSNSSSPS